MLHTQHLNFSVPQKQILHDINLSIEEGHIYALMGPNGSGKTTLLRCLSGLLEVPKSVFLNNTDITKMKAKEMSKYISVVPQRHHLAFDFTARQMVMMGRNPHQKYWQDDSEEDFRKVEFYMQKTHTLPFADEYVNRLSGGEYQRVLIARALVQETPFIFLDEPLSNLDISHQYEILDLLVEQNQKYKKTILLVLHDINMALQYTQKLLLLNHGRLVFSGNTSEGLTPERIREVFSVNASFAENGCKQQIYLSKIE